PGGSGQQPRSAGSDEAQATIPLSQGGGAGGGHCAGGDAAARTGDAAGVTGTVPRWGSRQGDNARLRGNEGATATPLHSLGRGRRTELNGPRSDCSRNGRLVSPRQSSGRKPDSRQQDTKSDHLQNEADVA